MLDHLLLDEAAERLGPCAAHEVVRAQVGGEGALLSGSLTSIDLTKARKGGEALVSSASVGGGPETMHIITWEVRRWAERRHERRWEEMRWEARR
tara:strand:- start:140 stop:424 length:285 start_codon:yes stop_codon:yes gene_type:complete